MTRYIVCIYSSLHCFYFICLSLCSHFALNKQPPSTAIYFVFLLSFLFSSSTTPSLLCTISTVSGLQRVTRHFLANKIDTWEMVRIPEAPKKPESLVVTSLSLLEIEKILGLTLVVDDEFDSLTPISVPQDLSMLARWIVQRNQLTSGRTLVGKSGPRSWH